MCLCSIWLCSDIFFWNLQRFIDPTTGRQRGSTNVVRQYNELGKTVSKIITPKVIEKIQEHFNCYTWPNAGAELEDFGGSGTAGALFYFSLKFRERQREVLFWCN